MRIPRRARAALPASGLYPIAVLTLTFLAYGAAAFVHASGFAAVYVAALVLGNSELPHRGGDQVVRRRRGVAGPDRALRDARAAALPWSAPGEVVGLALLAGLILTVLARPHLGPRQLDREPAPVARPDVPLVGRAAWRRPDRADDDPAGRGGRGRPQALRRGVRDGRRLHVADRPDPPDRREMAGGRPSQRAPRPRPRGGAAGADRGRPAPGHHHAGVPPPRRRGRRAPPARREPRSPC